MSRQRQGAFSGQGRAGCDAQQCGSSYDRLIGREKLLLLLLLMHRRWQPRLRQRRLMKQLQSQTGRERERERASGGTSSELYRR